VLFKSIIKPGAGVVMILFITASHWLDVKFFLLAQKLMMAILAIIEK
jgi:hypothetical protein